MVNSSNSDLESYLLKAVGRLSLGMDTSGTRNVLKLLCDEVDRRIAVDADRFSPSAFYVSKELACIAVKARALLE